MKKKITALALVICLLAVAVVGGTMAYFTDTDSAENVMTIGKVDIEQHEYQYDENGTLEAFTKDKPLVPYVGNFGWDTSVGGGNAYRRFTMNNVVDKYVCVENTGKSDAYVRTVFAFEMGTYTSVDGFYYDVLGTSNNAASGTEFQFDGTWIWGEKLVAEINGRNYLIMTAVHQDALESKSTTIPSLCQIYLSKDATNEIATAIDGNKDGKYSVYALTQAVQADGFDDAETALNEAFGEITEANVAALFTNAGYTL